MLCPLAKHIHKLHMHVSAAKTHQRQQLMALMAVARRVLPGETSLQNWPLIRCRFIVSRAERLRGDASLSITMASCPSVSETCSLCCTIHQMIEQQALGVTLRLSSTDVAGIVQAFIKPSFIYVVVRCTTLNPKP